MSFFNTLKKDIGGVVGGAEKAVGGFLGSLGSAVNQTNQAIARPVIQAARPVIAPLQAAGSVANSAARLGANNALGTAQAALQFGMVPVNNIRQDIALLTNNEPAFQSALDQSNQGAAQAVQAAQFVPRSFVQLAASVPGTTPHVSDNVYQPDNSLLNKVLLGSEPIPSLENVYKTAPGGAINKAVVAGGTGAIDLLAAFGGAKTIKEGLTSPELNNERGGGSFSKPTKDELSLGKALGMSESDVIKAKEKPPTVENPSPKEAAVKAISPASPEPIPFDAKARAWNVAKDLPSDSQTNLKDFITGRQAADVKATVEARKFKSLDSQGLDPVFKFQAGERGGQLSQLEDLWTKLREKENAAGVPTGEKQNYVFQAWKESPTEVAQTLGPQLVNLSLNPKFTFKSFISTYEDGIKAGLTPKYDTLSQIVQARVKSSEYAIATAKSLTPEIKNGNVAFTADAPIGYEPIKGTAYSGVPALARAYNNFLQPGGAVGELGSKIVGAAKNQLFTQGIPGTGINPHGVTTAAREALATPNIAHIPGSGLVAGTVKAVVHQLIPGIARHGLEANLESAVPLYEAGLTATGEGVKMRTVIDEAPKNFVQKLWDVNRKAFHDPVFQKQLPGAKQANGLAIYQNMIDRGVDPKVAAEASAKFENTFFGGNNVDAMFRNKDAQNTFRTVFLAPDLIESLAKTGSGIFKSLLPQNLLDPTYAPYRTVAGNTLLGFFVGANLLNKALSGHWIWDNPGNNKFQIDTGTGEAGPVEQAIIGASGLPIKYSQGERYIGLFGSALDFAKIPYEAGAGIVKGDISPAEQLVRNRLSPLTGAAVSLATNTNNLGNTISSPDQSVGQNAANAVNAIIGSSTPPVVSKSVQLAEGAVGLNPYGNSALKLAGNAARGKSTGRPRGSRKARVIKSRIGGSGIKRTRVARTRTGHTKAIRVSTRSRAIKALTRI